MPESLDDLHPLVAAAGRQLEGAKPDASGVVTSDARMAVAVSVRPETVERALRIWQALATAWEREGGTLSTAEGNAGGTVLAVAPDRISIRMMETTEPLRRGRGAGSKPTAPRLGFVLGDGAVSGIKSTWADTTTVRLEKMLRPLVDSVVEYLGAQRQVRLDGECEKRQQERALAVRRARANEVKEDFYLRHQLLQDVDRWERARSLRAYLHALRKRVEAGELAPRDPAAFSRWLEWAEWFADDMDPLCHPPPSEKPPAGPTNTPVQELDLTSRTRSVVAQLGVKDTDELSLVSEARVREIAGWSSGAWRELTLVLESHGYDVSKRKT